MGNPSILPPRFEPGGPPVEPPRTLVLWTVYLLRSLGDKLPPEQVLRTGKTGLLEVLPVGAGLRAQLLAPGSAEVLGTLWDARVIRYDHRGLLLHGSTISDQPQAWWCLVASAEPIGEKEPPATQAEG